MLEDVRLEGQGNEGDEGWGDGHQASSRERHFSGKHIHRGMEVQTHCGLQNLPGVSTSRRIKACGWFSRAKKSWF